jgi:alpha-beta hydrolase superfamily lysophospholipase
MKNIKTMHIPQFRFAKRLLKISLHVISGGFITLLVLAVVYLDRQPDLKIWHTVNLDAEFTQSSPIENFTDYLALEKRLFAQLKERVYDQISPEDQVPINRYFQGSLSDPENSSPNWNHSFELASQTSSVGVLLLHGMSDSPYSLRTLATRLHAEGAHVVGLRIPGHGTVPSGLAHVRWQDMAAAVKLAVNHLHERMNGKPLYIIGYSHGGALALHYALSTIEDSALPKVKKLVLISAEIGITKAAALAIWQERIGRLLGLEKLKWTDVLPEFDPFKYNSFTINAGNQAYRLTLENRSRIDTLLEANKLGQMPSVLAFQSVLDATVSAPALFHELFAKLPEGGHELVLFDINRNLAVEHFLKIDPGAHIKAISNSPDKKFIFSLITNENAQSEKVIVRTQIPGQTTVAKTDIDLSWPNHIFSVGHIALPFSPQDPLYGSGQQSNHAKLQLGNMALRGERGMLKIPASSMLRIHWNPFYPYLERRTVGHIFDD